MARRGFEYRVSENGRYAVEEETYVGGYEPFVWVTIARCPTMEDAKKCVELDPTRRKIVTD